MNPIQLEAPPLSVCWSDDGTGLFVGGCDNKGTRIDLAAQKSMQIAQHDQPVKFVKWVPHLKVLMTGSWDKTIKYWDGRQSAPALTVPLNEKVYAADVRDTLAVVATSNQQVMIYNLQNPQQIFRQVQSPLKLQTRCIKSFMDKSGYAIGSIEGRVGIGLIDPAKASDTNLNFAFKCHRIKNDIYAVNDIAFHPLGTFATAGADGNFHFWDKDSKQRLKAFKQSDQPISCCEFNAQGNLFAYAVCYDWSKGSQHYDTNKMKPHILIHVVQPGDVTPKAQQRKN